MRLQRKKLITSLVICALIVTMVLVFVFVYQPSKQNIATSHAYGTYIPVEYIEAPFDDGFDIAHIINGLGMSGTEGKHHTHSNTEEDMWRLTLRDQDIEAIEIVFDFGRIVPLGEMWIWNYNGFNEDTGELETDFGLKNIKILYSTDNEQWEEWQGAGYPFRLAKADGSDQVYATNLDYEDHTPIHFQGEPIRYLKIVANNKPGDGNWSESDHVYGLSEVRFYQHANQVVANDEIIPISVESFGFINETNPENLINGFGMNDSKYHDNDPDTMWFGKTKKDEDVSLTFNLGGAYPIKEMRVWNYHEQGHEDRGLKNIQVFHSLDGENWVELIGDGYPYQLSKADGDMEHAATNLKDEANSPIDFASERAQYIKIVPQQEEGNWGAARDQDIVYGLSAIQFIAAPGIAVEPAYEWDELFSSYNGWTGADGTYSLPLHTSEDHQLFLFSDTYIGNVHPVSRQRLQANMLNNTLAILQGTEPDPEKLAFIWSANISDTNLFTPKTPNSESGSWYWLQDGVVIEDTLYMFPILMVNDLEGDANFQFAIDDVTLISLPLSEEGEPIIEEQEQIDTPLFQSLDDEDGNMLFGATVLDQTDVDGHLYIYGYKDFTSGQKDLVAARTKPEHIDNFEQWEYWNGDTWTDNMLDATTLINNVSPELSVHYSETGPYEGKYVAAYSHDTLSGYIAISVSDQPQGPFSEPELLYFVPEAHEDDVITYNAKAHPQLSAPGELLISYNVNSVAANGNMANADIYRPRWVKVKEIKEVN